MIDTLFTQAQLGAAHLAFQIVDPAPDASFPGNELATSVLGWLKWIGLAGCLASLFIGGAVWGLSQVGGNSMQAGRGRSFALGGAAGSIVIGLGAQIVNQLSGLG